MTAYRPTSALSASWLNASLRSHGYCPTSPVTGRIGTSPKIQHPAAACVMEKPRIAWCE
ncbi:Uncharacterised protein [Mycobacteroides abscessus]|nr:Uncharacterised protein [Mycobacteroides abscessus]